VKKKLLFVILAGILLVAACVPSQEQVNEIINSVEQTALAQVTIVSPPTQDVNAIVQATFQALTAQAATATPAAATAGTGSISGQVLPGAGHVGAFQIGTDAFYKLELPNGQLTYQIDNLPPGQYYVLAFTSAGGHAAPFPFAYSQYVVCGLTENCTDHGMIPVTVTAGQLTANINILDNYGIPDRNPYMIKYFGYDQNNTGTDNIPTNTPPGGQAGSISGTLSYPAEGLPAMAVVAFHVGGAPTDYYFVATAQNQSTYQIDNLPVGNYWVVAYSLGGPGFPVGLAGGYTQYVVCGMQPPCSNHALMEVSVIAGQVTGNINPQDWYAPEGTLPENPLP
jgi:hypothetical protein